MMPAWRAGFGNSRKSAQETVIENKVSRQIYDKRKIYLLEWKYLYAVRLVRVF